ncbi:hypothetical protein SAMN05443633_11172 [Chryseobacterium arachidis]|uniref:DoxX-like family protein n=2 Tax=Chryseobacterium arachidis TaxID=1416778 RepID=A0A1M5HUK5_9FLAO|nr:hypothetical protein [Chryseobacterium arachidis]SHG19565.1 hypothetical protein SAMN05443633_11172 [Chryseobacterium arachidis]
MMFRNIISLVLLIISVILNFKHGWDTFNYKKNSGSDNIMNELGITEPMIPFLGIFTIIIGILLMMPKTYFIGNLLNASSILLIMALALQAGNYKIALIEIPFLALPLIMIGLKYPFRN